MVVKEMKKENVKEFLLKIRKFNLLDFLLQRVVSKHLDRISLQEGLINYHKGLIKDAEDTIKSSTEMIALVKTEISMLYSTLDDIKKIH